MVVPLGFEPRQGGDLPLGRVIGALCYRYIIGPQIKRRADPRIVLIHVRPQTSDKARESLHLSGGSTTAHQMRDNWHWYVCYVLQPNGARSARTQAAFRPNRLATIEREWYQRWWLKPHFITALNSAPLLLGYAGV
jgi:hypothetical protein